MTTLRVSNWQWTQLSGSVPAVSQSKSTVGLAGRSPALRAQSKFAARLTGIPDVQ